MENSKPVNLTCKTKKTNERDDYIYYNNSIDADALRLLFGYGVGFLE